MRLPCLTGTEKQIKKIQQASRRLEMIYLCFELTMPNRGSWNGRWTGERNYYAVVEKFPKKHEARAKEILQKGYFHYNFGDGWSAGIKVTATNAKDAKAIRRISSGFCNYDWMIESIKKNLKIEIGSE